VGPGSDLGHRFLGASRAGAIGDGRRRRAGAAVKACSKVR